MPDSRLRLEDVKLIREQVIQPMLDSITSHMDPIVKACMDQLRDHEVRIKKVEDDRTKALVGYGVFSTGLAAGLAYFWTWIKSKVHLG